MTRILTFPRTARDWLFANQRNVPFDAADQRRPIVFFYFCIAFYCLYLLLMQGEWILGGEIWAEAATNYYQASVSPSLFEKFLTRDTGYIPLPQRLLAVLGNAFGLPARSIPYFYTWSAILLTAAMVGAFCLAPFRTLVRNDHLRLFTAIAVLMVADFESRTFINFTYFAAFLVTIVTALAFVERDKEVPKWAWILPVLLMSKPAVLAALPAMVIVALVSKARFRLITIAAAILGVAQVLIMFSNPGKSFLGIGIYGPIDKLAASFQYFLGFLGVFFLGLTESAKPGPLIFAGVIILLACLLALFKRRTNAGALVIVGLSLLLFDIIVHCFAFTGSWNIKLERLTPFHFERHIIAGYFGVVLVITGLIALITEATRTSKHTGIFKPGPLLFLAWFICAGWFAQSGTLGKSPGFPRVNNSQWQAMAAVIDSDHPVCVPIDPLGMVFQRNCHDFDSIAIQFMMRGGINFSALQAIEGKSVLELPPTVLGAGKNLISVAILVRPGSGTSIAVDADAVLKLKDGSLKYLSGSRRLPADGGLIMMTGEGSTAVNDIQSVTFKFSTLVDVGSLIPKGSENGVPTILWMGN